MMHLEMEQKIRARAHELWEQGGRMDGRSEEHWWLAEREMARKAEAAPAVVTLAVKTLDKPAPKKAKASPSRKIKSAAA